MKKVLKIVFILMLVGAIAGCIFLFLQKEKVIADRNALIQQNSQLQQSIDAIGPLTTCYTVKTTVKPGDEVIMDNLVSLTVPASNTSDNTVVSLDDICGPNVRDGNKYYYKVRVEPNTQLTKDLIMQDYMEAPVYERDVILPFKPIGLKVGDYIDIRVTLPGGEELRALPHKRVYMVLDNVIKLKMTEGELYVYSTLLTDKQYFSNIGLKVYATKYIEPGLSNDTPPIPMYPISNYAATLMNRDVEVTNKNDYINTDLRKYIEGVLLLYADAEPGTVFPGLPTTQHESTESGVLNSAQELYVDTYFGEDGEPAATVNDISGTGSDGNMDGVESGRTGTTGNVISDLNQSTGNSAAELQDNLEDLTDKAQQQQPVETTEGTNPPTMENVDSEGNRSNVSNQSKVEAKSSGNIFTDEDDIN